MSVQSIVWVIEDAPKLKPHLVSTLIGLANHADRYGRGSYPSQPTLSSYTRKTDRQVRRDLEDLKKAGLIRLGDQRLVAHIPADERPVVYDLAVELKKDQIVPAKTPRKRKGPDTHDRPVVEVRPDVEVQRDRTSMAEGPDAHVLLTNYQPKDEPKDADSLALAGRRASEPLSLTQRSKLITDAYAAVEPMCKWPAVNAIVIRAIKAERWSDDEIRAGVLRLAGEGRPVTVETLRIELMGLPPRAVNGTPNTNQAILARAMERARAKEAGQ